MECYKLDDILKLNLPNKEEIKDKFNKRVFYDNEGSCQLGVLIGISDTSYIIDINGNKKHIPLWKSITKV